MRVAVFISGIVLIIIVLFDAFETMVLPRRVTRRIRLVRLFYRITWHLWSSMTRILSSENRRENYLSYYGPLSLLVLLGFWATVLISSFALMYWAPGNSIKTPEGPVSFIACLYFSGTTFFTLGLGDVVPVTSLARLLIALEAGLGFGFLAIVISYLPAQNQSFSRREVNIALLDARAGSPPTALEMLRRHAQKNAMDTLNGVLHEWERWSAELLESHLSFPVLVYFRSQHDNQSWLAALTSILDTCAFAMTSLEGENEHQPQLTFAMARHAIVDLSLILHTEPRDPMIDRLPQAELDSMRSLLAAEGMRIRKGAEADEQLRELRRMYEPYVHALSERLFLSLPPWIPTSGMPDNWQVSSGGKNAGARRSVKLKRLDTGHF